MKTDKKKLMRKLIAVGLMASMLATNTMTYGSSFILPSINAEALTISEAGATTYDISTMEADPVSEIIEINITENGTYIFTGTNLRNEGQANECYIDVQVTVPAGVEANFIFDDCTILNNCDIDSSGYGEYPEEAFVINGTVNIYVKSTSKILTYNDGSTDYAHEKAITFTGNGTVNVMESEDKDQSLEISTIDTASLNINGGILDVFYLRSKELAINDGTVYDGSWPSYISNVETLSYKGGNAYLDGNYPAYSLFANIGADKQITDLNGTKLKQTYSVNSDNGLLQAYIDYSLFSASNAPYLVADNELLVYTDAGSQYMSNSVNLGDPAALKITKEYDGTTSIDEQAIEQITMNGYTLTPDLSAVTCTGSDVGEYTATVPFKFTESGTEYTFYYSVPVEITAAPLTIKSVTVADKTYDGTTDATVTAVEFDGAVAGDKVEYTATAEFADKAAGKDKEVTVTVTLKDSTYTLTESKFTAKADINFAGNTENVSYESVEDMPSLPNADDFVDEEGNGEGNGEGLIVVKSPKTETRDYYFAYLVKSEKFKIGDAAPKTGTFYVALNDKGEKTRKFTVSIPFTTVIIDGKTYKAPDGYAYYVFGITDVPIKYDLHCSENIELN